MRKRKSKGRKKQFARYVLRVNNSKIQHHVSGPSLLFNQSFTGLPAGIYLLKVNNRNTRTSSVNNRDIRTTSLASIWCLFIVNFEYISHLVPVRITLKIFISPFYGGGSTASRLLSHQKEAVYF